MPKKIVKAVKKNIKKSGKKPKTKPKTKIPPAVLKYLEKTGIDHAVLEHRTVYTAIDAAMTLKKQLDEIAKSLLIMANKDYYLVLLPADKNLDFDKLSKVISREAKKEITSLKIPGEKVMGDLLKLKSGGVTAFGRLYNLPVVMEKSLSNVKKAIFPSGSYNHSIEMLVSDFVKMENAVLGTFGIKKKVKMQTIKTKSKKAVAKKKVVPKKKSATKKKK
jgi:Ala-tRNA(Pro) deacylase